MTGVLDRLVSCFVAPRDPDGDGTAAESGMGSGSPAPGRGGGRSAPTAVRDDADRDVALVCRPADAAAAGGAVALALRSRRVIVALWGAQPPAFRAPATPGARHLVARLAARGHVAVATGRLVFAVLGSGPEEAFRAGAGASAALVTVVAAARDERVDAVLRGHERVITVGTGGLADLAVASLAGAGIPSETLALPDAPVARGLAALGVALVGPLRTPVTEALR